jgi:hypothetical protein
VAAGFYHLRRGNLTGARKLFSNARRRLSDFSDDPCGIDLAGLLADIDRIETNLDEPSRLDGLLRPIRYKRQTPEDE